MAPNNALKDDSRKNKKKKTSVLEAGTVESRGIGSKDSPDIIDSEIQQFLEGEGRLSITAEARAFFTVWTFLTRLPGPTWVDHHPGYLMRGMAYFPFAGSLVGIFVSVVFDFAHEVFHVPSVIAAAACTAASLWLTGCFHEDGLADASDGIGGGWSRIQILTIMTDTRLGTYGCAVLTLYLITKLQLLASLGTSSWDAEACRGAGPALLLSHTLARFTAPFLVRTRDYVDDLGPKTKYYSFMVQAKHLVSWERVACASFTSIVISACTYGMEAALLLMGLTVFISHFAGKYGTYLLGGVMGDYLGAIICLTELALLTLILILQESSLPWAELPTWGMHSYVTDFFQRIRTGEFTMNDSIGTTLRFTAVMIFTIVWCFNVGHPPVLVRETLGKEDKQEPKKKFSPKINNKSFEEQYQDALCYLDSLAKPVGALGTLEHWAAQLVALQRTSSPILGSAVCLIFAGDHGVNKPIAEGGENCSAFPSIVTQSILSGLERQVAGASVLAKQNDVIVHVVDVGVSGYLAADGNNIVVSANHKVPDGTKNFCVERAMTKEETNCCVEIGKRMLTKQVDINGSETIIVLGEVGIGNTTSSSALISALTGENHADICGGGAMMTRSVDPDLLAKKIEIVGRGLKKHRRSILQPFQKEQKNIKANSKDGNQLAIEILGTFGGAEIAAMVGCILEAKMKSIPVLVDGFIVTAAALVAVHVDPTCCRNLFLTTKSAEKGQAVAISAIQAIARHHGLLVPADPIFNMELRLGEGSGAIMAVPILRSAVTMFTNMATLNDILQTED